MKKTIIIVISLLLVTLASAIMLSNKQEALDYVRSSKINLESSIGQAEDSFEYKTDKECTVDYETENIRCIVCFNYLYKDRLIDDCIDLPTDSTEQYDREVIQERIRGEILASNNQEEVKYIERKLMKGK